MFLFKASESTCSLDFITYHLLKEIILYNFSL